MVGLLRLISRGGSSVIWRRFNSSNQPSTQSTFKKLLDKAKDFISFNEQETFHIDLIKRSHRFDKVNQKEWMLIYRDESASRTFIMMSISIPLVIIFTSFFIWDITTNEQKERSLIVQKLTKDAKQLGIFIVFPIVSAVIVLLLLLRIHSLRILRIYQNRAHSDSYLLVGPTNMGTLTQTQFHRDHCISSHIEHENDLARVGLHFVFGNLQIDRNRYLIDDDHFRANVYRTFMVNETNVPPRLNFD